MQKTLINLIKCFYPPGLVFAIHIIFGGYLNFYQVYPNFDIPMHFLGGFSMGITALFLLRLAEKENWMKIHKKLISLVIALCFVALTATVWEFLEWAGDHYLYTYMQESLTDTMGDMALGLLGGCVAWICLNIRRKRSVKT